MLTLNSSQGCFQRYRKDSETASQFLARLTGNTHNDDAAQRQSVPTVIRYIGRVTTHCSHQASNRASRPSPLHCRLCCRRRRRENTGKHRNERSVICIYAVFSSQHINMHRRNRDPHCPAQFGVVAEIRQHQVQARGQSEEGCRSRRLPQGQSANDCMYEGSDMT